MPWAVERSVVACFPLHNSTPGQQGQVFGRRAEVEPDVLGTIFPTSEYLPWVRALTRAQSSAFHSILCSVLAAELRHRSHDVVSGCRCRGILL